MFAQKWKQKHRSDPTQSKWLYQFQRPWRKRHFKWAAVTSSGSPQMNTERNQEAASTLLSSRHKASMMQDLR